MTDEELSAVREFAGDLLVRAFRGEVDLASGLAEIRDLTPQELVEESELPDDLDDDDGETLPEGGGSPEGDEPPADEEPFVLDADIEAELTAAVDAALNG